MRKPRIEVDIHGRGEKLIAKLVKVKYPAAQIVDDDESIPFRETEFAKEMERTVTPGRMLWVYRDNAELTLDELAKKTGINKSHLSEMENDKRGIGVRTARKLGAALRCDYRRFL